MARQLKEFQINIEYLEQVITARNTFAQGYKLLSVLVSDDYGIPVYVEQSPRMLKRIHAVLNDSHDNGIGIYTVSKSGHAWVVRLGSSWLKGAGTHLYSTTLYFSSNPEHTGAKA